MYTCVSARFTSSRYAESLRGIANAIRLEREVFGEQRERRRVLRLRGQAHELDLVAGDRRRRAGLEHRRAFVGRRARAPPWRRLRVAAQQRVQPLLGRGVADARRSSCRPGRQRSGSAPSVLDEEAAAVDEDRGSRSRQSSWRVSVCVVFAHSRSARPRLHHCEALGDRAGHPVDLEVGLADRAADLGDDALAEVDRVAGRLCRRRTRTAASRAKRRR